MKILTFGWEFLPHITKRLGTASHGPTIKVDFSVLASAKYGMHCYSDLSAALKKNAQEEIKTINWVKAEKKTENLYEPIYTKYCTET